MIRFRTLGILIILAGLILPVATAQKQNPAMPETAGEKLGLVTDRSLYVVGEPVFFSVGYEKPPLPEAYKWSTVLYVEMIRWNGSVLARTKVPVEGKTADGLLEIPSNIESGIYYLRAYTRWMRNFSPYRYTYTIIRVVNPSTGRTERGAATVDLPRRAGEKYRLLSDNELQLSGLKKTVGRRSSVTLEVSPAPGLLKGPFSVSIVRKGLMEPSASWSYRVDPDTLAPAGPFFYPEIRGVTLSGQVVERESGTACAGHVVHLSSVESPFYFSSVATDSLGKFMFSFPQLAGQYEFHIGSEQGGSCDDGASEILVDNDFCNKPVQLPYIPFKLDDAEQELVREIALNAQLNNRFENSGVEAAPGEKNLHPFYGHPIRTVRQEEYIELDDLEEFLFELVYEVSVRYEGDEPYLQISSQTSLVGYPPLVLLDNLPVQDFSDFLAIPCNQLDRVEVLNRGYVIGDFRYSGIVSVYTSDRNRGGLQFFDNSQFFTYGLYGEARPLFPDYSKISVQSPVPDLRNTLFWEPAAMLDEEGVAIIHYYTGDAAGNYEVVIRGTDHEGMPVIFRSEPFMVE
mgnify:CR=1 FL=1